MKITETRTQFTFCGKRLRRARRLYIHLCAAAILADTTDDVIHRVFKRMIDSGLYAKPSNMTNICWRHGRYRILRYLYKRDGSPGHQAFGWFNWCHNHGYDQHFNKKPQLQQTA